MLIAILIFKFSNVAEQVRVTSANYLHATILKRRYLFPQAEEFNHFPKKVPLQRVLVRQVIPGFPLSFSAVDPSTIVDFSRIGQICVIVHLTKLISGIKKRYTADAHLYGPEHINPSYRFFDQFIVFLFNCLLEPRQGGQRSGYTDIARIRIELKRYPLSK